MFSFLRILTCLESVQYSQNLIVPLMLSTSFQKVSKCVLVLSNIAKFQLFQQNLLIEKKETLCKAQMRSEIIKQHQHALPQHLLIKWSVPPINDGTTQQKERCLSKYKVTKCHHYYICQNAERSTRCFFFFWHRAAGLVHSSIAQSYSL